MVSDGKKCNISRRILINILHAKQEKTAEKRTAFGPHQLHTLTEVHAVLTDLEHFNRSRPSFTMGVYGFFSLF